MYGRDTFILVTFSYDSIPSPNMTVVLPKHRKRCPTGTRRVSPAGEYPISCAKPTVSKSRNPKRTKASTGFKTSKSNSGKYTKLQLSTYETWKDASKLARSKGIKTRPDLNPGSPDLFAAVGSLLEILQTVITLF